MNIDDLMQQLPIDQIAARLGVDSAEAQSASRQALTALVGGMGANAQDPAGALSLRDALAQHADDPDDFDVDRVDENDGNKIVGHIFGGNADAVVNQLGGLGGSGGSSLMSKLLPLLAPLVLSYLAKNVLGKGAGSTAPGGGGGGLGDILGGLLGGGGGGLGDLLGGVLGGDRPAGSAGGSGVDVGDILGGLGGLLGGGTKR